MEKLLIGELLCTVAPELVDKDEKVAAGLVCDEKSLAVLRLRRNNQTCSLPADHKQPENLNQ